MGFSPYNLKACIVLSFTTEEKSIHRLFSYFHGWNEKSRFFYLTTLVFMKIWKHGKLEGRMWAIRTLGIKSQNLQKAVVYTSARAKTISFLINGDKHVRFPIRPSLNKIGLEVV